MKQIVDKLNKIAKKIDDSVELPNTDLITDSLDAITKALGGTPNDSNLIVDKLEDIAGVAEPKPTGNIELTENAENIDVAQYRLADVNVNGEITSVEEKDINFYDYDGTRLHSYTVQEFEQLSDLPQNPSHDGLTAQGWNWAKEEITSQITNVGGVVNVGQTYLTQQNAFTYIYCYIAQGRQNIMMKFKLSGTATIYWGDNSNDPYTGNNTLIEATHTYSTAGKYIISIRLAGTQLLILGNSSSKQSEMLCKPSYTNGNENIIFLSGIEKIEYGKNVSVRAYGLSTCRGLETTSFGDVAERAYYYCSSLKASTIIRSKTTINSYAFYSCSALKNVVLPPTITGIEQCAFQGCSTLESVTLPITLTSIGDYAFNGCYLLRSITVPNSVTTIGSFAFDNTGLSIVTIPESVTQIGGSAFGKGLAELHVMATTPPTLTGTLNLAPDCKVYVPAESLAAYQAATNWSNLNLEGE